VSAPRAPPAGVPWAELRDEMSPQQLVIIGFILRLVLRSTRDEISIQVPRIMGEYSNYASPRWRDELGVTPPGS